MKQHSRMEKIGFAAWGTASIAGTIGGFFVAETLNDTSLSEVTAVIHELDEAEAAYLGVAGDGSCEQNVLATMVKINAVNTPKDMGLTKDALNNVCPSEVIDHTEMAEDAVAKYASYSEIKTSKLPNVKDDSHFDTFEKFEGIGLGALVPSFTVLAGLAIYLAGAVAIDTVKALKRGESIFQSFR